MDKTQDLLRKGFYLAHFIIPDRPTAIRILSDATSKLEVHRSQEKKRIYWRHKYLKRKITRVIRQDNDMLQWLIYLEAEKHERQQEQSSRSTADDLVIRYIKHLAQVTTPMSSFYVNIGFQRLLYSYSTAETRNIYEWMTNHFPSNEEYRKIKATLMSRLQTRFGNFLRTRQTHRGEVRFEPHGRPEDLDELVQRCLDLFTPWSTSQACGASSSLGQIHWLRDRYVAKIPSKDSVDSVETYRSHFFIHPPCFSSLVKQLGLASPHKKLSVPQFFLSTHGDHQSKSRASREPTSDLTEQERQTISGRLNREAIQRQQIQPERLRILVDGREALKMELSRQRSMRCELQEGARLVEVWTADRDEDILIGTHWIDYSELHKPVAAEAKIDLGKTKQLWLRIIPDISSTALLLDFRLTSAWGLGKGNFTSPFWRQLWPKSAVAMSAVLLMSAVIAIIAYHNETVRQRATIESVNQELARERNSRVAVQQRLANSASQLTASFRLSVDNVRPRGLQEQEIPRLTIPLHSVLVSLDLPVGTPAQSRYRATLRSLLGSSVILEEDYLKSVTLGENDSKVIFSVPASLLLPDKYYVTRLETVDELGKPAKSHTFTFYVANKN